MANEVRLIDGNKLEAVLRNISDHLEESGEPDFSAFVYVVADIVQKQPTIDAVAVVRCKDCCSCLIDNNSIREHHLCMRGYPLLQKRVKLDDFCSYGKRKEGADNE